LKSEAPVGRFLADQLLIPMALAGGGKFRTLAPSNHTRTNIEVVKMFLDVNVKCEEKEKDLWEIEIEKECKNEMD
jgi:RNA 3'-terminal phosphate cyclase (ATP)